MTLKIWLENKWLKPHRVNQKEVTGLLSIVDRDIKDAGAALSRLAIRHCLQCRA
jgi:D-serine dehydratase